MKYVISVAAILLVNAGVFALPQGGRIESGAGNLDNPAHIIQESQHLQTRWNSFDIGATERVRIEQPNAQSSINIKVRNGAATNINGTLTANGRVSLENPAGIQFGANSVVNVGGLLASSATGAVTSLGQVSAAEVVRFQGLSSKNIVNVGGAVSAQEIIVESNGDIVIGNSAHFTASKQVLIGGGYQGKDLSVLNARTTDVKAAAQINAPYVIVWSDKETSFLGRINAGKGFVEVSGKQNLIFPDISRAKAGTLLLDPQNLFISTAGANVDSKITGDGIISADEAGVSFYITPSAIENYVGNVSLAATGTILLQAAVTKSNGSLMLSANKFSLSAVITISGTGNYLSLELTGVAGATSLVVGAGAGIVTNDLRVAVNYTDSNYQFSTTSSSANLLAAPGRSLTMTAPANVNFKFTSYGFNLCETDGSGCGNLSLTAGNVRLGAAHVADNITLTATTGYITFNGTATMVTGNSIRLTQDAEFPNSAPATFNVKPTILRTGGTQGAVPWANLVVAADIVVDNTASGANIILADELATGVFSIVGGVLDLGTHSLSLTTTGTITLPVGLTRITTTGSITMMGFITMMAGTTTTANQNTLTLDTTGTLTLGGTFDYRNLTLVADTLNLSAAHTLGTTTTPSGGDIRLTYGTLQGTPSRSYRVENFTVTTTGTAKRTFGDAATTWINEVDASVTINTGGDLELVVKIASENSTLTLNAGGNGRLIFTSNPIIAATGSITLSQGSLEGYPTAAPADFRGAVTIDDRHGEVSWAANGGLTLQPGNIEVVSGDLVGALRGKFDISNGELDLGNFHLTVGGAITDLAIPAGITRITTTSTINITNGLTATAALDVNTSNRLTIGGTWDLGGNALTLTTGSGAIVFNSGTDITASSIALTQVDAYAETAPAVFNTPPILNLATSFNRPASWGACGMNCLAPLVPADLVIINGDLETALISTFVVSGGTLDLGSFNLMASGMTLTIPSTITTIRTMGTISITGGLTRTGGSALTLSADTMALGGIFTAGTLFLASQVALSPTITAASNLTINASVTVIAKAGATSPASLGSLGFDLTLTRVAASASSLTLLGKNITLNGEVRADTAGSNVTITAANDLVVNDFAIVADNALTLEATAGGITFNTNPTITATSIALTQADAFSRSVPTTNFSVTPSINSAQRAVSWATGGISGAADITDTGGSDNIDFADAIAGYFVIDGSGVLDLSTYNLNISTGGTITLPAGLTRITGTGSITIMGSDIAASGTQEGSLTLETTGTLTLGGNFNYRTLTLEADTLNVVATHRLGTEIAPAGGDINLTYRTLQGTPNLSFRQDLTVRTTGASKQIFGDSATAWVVGGRTTTITTAGDLEIAAGTHNFADETLTLNAGGNGRLIFTGNPTVLASSGVILTQGSTDEYPKARPANFSPRPTIDGNHNRVSWASGGGALLEGDVALTGGSSAFNLLDEIAAYYDITSNALNLGDSNLTVSGNVLDPSTITSITTSGTISITGGLTTTAALSLDAGTMALGGTFTAGSNALTLISANDITAGSALTISSALTLSAASLGSAGSTLTLANVTGSAALALLGSSITLNGSVNVGTNTLTITAAAGDITFNNNPTITASSIELVQTTEFARAAPAATFTIKPAIARIGGTQQAVPWATGGMVTAGNIANTGGSANIILADEIAGFFNIVGGVLDLSGHSLNISTSGTITLPAGLTRITGTGSITMMGSDIASGNQEGSLTLDTTGTLTLGGNFNYRTLTLEADTLNVVATHRLGTEIAPAGGDINLIYGTLQGTPNLSFRQDLTVRTTGASKQIFGDSATAWVVGGRTTTITTAGDLEIAAGTHNFADETLTLNAGGNGRLIFTGNPTVLASSGVILTQGSTDEYPKARPANFSPRPTIDGNHNRVSWASGGGALLEGDVALTGGSSAFNLLDEIAAYYDITSNALNLGDSNLTVSGNVLDPSTITSITTSGTISITGGLTTTAALSLDAGTMALGGTFTAGSNALTLISANAITAASALTISSALTLSAASLGSTGSTLTLANVTGSAALALLGSSITLNGSVNVGTNTLTITAAAGAITFNNAPTITAASIALTQADAFSRTAPTATFSIKPAIARTGGTQQAVPWATGGTVTAGNIANTGGSANISLADEIAGFFNIVGGVLDLSGHTLNLSTSGTITLPATLTRITGTGSITIMGSATTSGTQEDLTLATTGTLTLGGTFDYFTFALEAGTLDLTATNKLGSIAFALGNSVNLTYGTLQGTPSFTGAFALTVTTTGTGKQTFDRAVLPWLISEEADVTINTAGDLEVIRTTSTGALGSLNASFSLNAGGKIIFTGNPRLIAGTSINLSQVSTDEYPKAAPADFGRRPTIDGNHNRVSWAEGGGALLGGDIMLTGGSSAFNLPDEIAAYHDVTSNTLDLGSSNLTVSGNVLTSSAAITSITTTGTISITGGLTTAAALSVSADTALTIGGTWDLGSNALALTVGAGAIGFNSGSVITADTITLTQVAEFSAVAPTTVNFSGVRPAIVRTGSDQRTVPWATGGLATLAGNVIVDAGSADIIVADEIMGYFEIEADGLLAIGAFTLSLTTAGTIIFPANLKTIFGTGSATLLFSAAGVSGSNTTTFSMTAGTLALKGAFDFGAASVTVQGGNQLDFSRGAVSITAGNLNLSGAVSASGSLAGSDPLTFTTTDAMTLNRHIGSSTTPMITLSYGGILSGTPTLATSALNITHTGSGSTTLPSWVFGGYSTTLTAPSINITGATTWTGNSITFTGNTSITGNGTLLLNVSTVDADTNNLKITLPSLTLGNSTTIKAANIELIASAGAIDFGSTSTITATAAITLSQTAAYAVSRPAAFTPAPTLTAPSNFNKPTWGVCGMNCYEPANLTITDGDLGTIVSGKFDISSGTLDLGSFNLTAHTMPLTIPSTITTITTTTGRISIADGLTATAALNLHAAGSTAPVLGGTFTSSNTLTLTSANAITAGSALTISSALVVAAPSLGSAGADLTLTGNVSSSAGSSALELVGSNITLGVGTFTTGTLTLTSANAIAASSDLTISSALVVAAPSLGSTGFSLNLQGVTSSSVLALVGSTITLNDAVNVGGNALTITAAAGGIGFSNNPTITGSTITLTQVDVFPRTAPAATFSVTPAIVRSGGAEQRAVLWATGGATIGADVELIGVAHDINLEEAIIGYFEIDSNGLLDLGDFDLALLTSGKVTFPARLKEIRTTDSLQFGAGSIEGVGTQLALVTGTLFLSDALDFGATALSIRATTEFSLLNTATTISADSIELHAASITQKAALTLTARTGSLTLSGDINLGTVYTDVLNLNFATTLEQGATAPTITSFLITVRHTGSGAITLPEWLFTGQDVNLGVAEITLSADTTWAVRFLGFSGNTTITGTTVALTLSATGTAPRITSNADLTIDVDSLSFGSDMLLASATNLNITSRAAGADNAFNLSLGGGSNLTVAGHINAGTGDLTLQATGGKINFTSNPTITGKTITLEQNATYDPDEPATFSVKPVASRLGLATGTVYAITTWSDCPAGDGLCRAPINIAVIDQTADINLITILGTNFALTNGGTTLDLLGSTLELRTTADIILPVGLTTITTSGNVTFVGASILTVGTTTIGNHLTFEANALTLGGTFNAGTNNLTFTTSGGALRFATPTTINGDAIILLGGDNTISSPANVALVVTSSSTLALAGVVNVGTGSIVLTAGAGAINFSHHSIVNGNLTAATITLTQVDAYDAAAPADFNGVPPALNRSGSDNFNTPSWGVCGVDAECFTSESIDFTATGDETLADIIAGKFFVTSAGILDLGSSSLSINIGGALTLPAGLAQIVTDSNNITLIANTFTNPGSLTIETTTSGDLTFQGSYIAGTNGLTLTAAGALNFGTGAETSLSGNLLTLGSGAAATASGQKLTLVGNLAITFNNTDINVAELVLDTQGGFTGTPTITADDLTLTYRGGNSSTSTYAGSHWVFAAGRNVTLSTPNSGAIMTLFAANATDTIDLCAADGTNCGNLTLESGNSIQLAGSTQTSASLGTISANNISLKAASIGSGSNVNRNLILNVAGDLTIDTPTFTLRNTHGAALTFNVAGSTTFVQDITLDAETMSGLGGTITAQALTLATAASATGSITFDATRPTNITATGAVSMDAASITEFGGTLTAPSLTLTSSGSATSSLAFSTTQDTIITTTGAVSIDAATITAFGGTFSASALTLTTGSSATGSIAFSTTQAINITTTGAVSIDAATTITEFGGTFTADSLTLTTGATGSLAFSTTQAANITTTGAVSIDAATITEFDGTFTAPTLTLTTGGLATGSIAFSATQDTTATGAVSMDAASISGLGGTLTATTLTLSSSGSSTGSLTFSSTRETNIITTGNILFEFETATATPSGQNLNLTATGGNITFGTLNIGGGTLEVITDQNVAFTNNPTITALEVYLTWEGSTDFANVAPATFTDGSTAPPLPFIEAANQTDGTWFQLAGFSIDAGAADIDFSSPLTLVRGAERLVVSVSAAGVLDFGPNVVRLTTTGNIIFPASVREIRASDLTINAATTGSGASAAPFANPLSIITTEDLELNTILAMTAGTALNLTFADSLEGALVLTTTSLGITSTGTATTTLPSWVFTNAAREIRLSVATIAFASDETWRAASITFGTDTTITSPDQLLLNIPTLDAGANTLTINVARLNFSRANPTNITGGAISLTAATASTTGSGENLTITAATGNLTLAGTLNVSPGVMSLIATQGVIVFTSSPRLRAAAFSLTQGGAAFPTTKPAIFINETSANVAPTIRYTDGVQLPVDWDVVTFTETLVETAGGGFDLGTGALAIFETTPGILDFGNTDLILGTDNNISIPDRITEIRGRNIIIRATMFGRGAPTAANPLNRNLQFVAAENIVFMTDVQSNSRITFEGRSISFNDKKATRISGSEIFVTTTDAGLANNQNVTLRSTGNITLAANLNLGVGTLVVNASDTIVTTDATTITAYTISYNASAVRNAANDLTLTAYDNIYLRGTSLNNRDAAVRLTAGGSIVTRGGFEITGSAVHFEQGQARYQAGRLVLHALTGGLTIVGPVAHEMLTLRVSSPEQLNRTNAVIQGTVAIEVSP